MSVLKISENKRKQQDAGENCIIRHFMIFTPTTNYYVETH